MLLVAITWFVFVAGLLWLYRHEIGRFLIDMRAELAKTEHHRRTTGVIAQMRAIDRETFRRIQQIGRQNRALP